MGGIVFKLKWPTRPLFWDVGIIRARRQLVMRCCCCSCCDGGATAEIKYAMGLYAVLLLELRHDIVGGSLNLFMATTGDVLNNPIFSSLGLCAACWAHFMCHYKLWPSSVSHPFSFPNSSLGLAGGKYYLKITIPVFRVVLQNFAIQVPFLIFFSIAIFSPYYLLVDLLLQYVILFQSGNYLSN